MKDNKNEKKLDKEDLSEVSAGAGKNSFMDIPPFFILQGSQPGKSICDCVSGGSLRKPDPNCPYCKGTGFC